jgi:hypothetical protein
LYHIYMAFNRTRARHGHPTSYLKYTFFDDTHIALGCADRKKENKQISTHKQTKYSSQILSRFSNSNSFFLPSKPNIHSYTPRFQHSGFFSISSTMHTFSRSFSLSPQPDYKGSINFPFSFLFYYYIILINNIIVWFEFWIFEVTNLLLLFMNRFVFNWLIQGGLRKRRCLARREVWKWNHFRFFVTFEILVINL